MFVRKLVPALLGLAITYGVAPRARAETPEDVARARELFVEGARLAEQGSWEEARDRFERSLQKKRAAITLYNLGVAQEETGRVRDAIESFRAFLAMPVEPATHGYVAPVKAALAKLEARVAQIEVEVRPAGVSGLSVRVDGKEAKPPNGPWIVDPGRHEIVAGAPGHADTHHTISVGQGGKSTIVVQLAPNPPSLALPAALGGSGLALFVGGEIVFAVGAVRGLKLGGDQPSKTMIVAGNVIAGTGALAAGVGLILLLSRPRAASASASIVPWTRGDVVGLEARFR